MNIAVLDNDTINKIAAGEVIERPASIVKELSENAIDAGATVITVEIKDGGTTLIRVTDNGCGIPKEDVKNAFLRHSTSKIRNAADLMHLDTLGFRGEALSSIASVCRTEMITKKRGSLTGTRYVIEGGTEGVFEEVGAPDGTTIIARDIFFHTPARRKFLKTPATEASRIAELSEQLAISHPDISFFLIINGQTKFHTSGNGNIRDIIYQLYGREIAGALISLDFEKNGITIRGYIGKPEISRGNRDLENYYINGRFVKNKAVSGGIEEGYGRKMMQHQYPFTVLMIQTDPEKTDVNVHPSKMEVRFSEPQAVFQTVSEAVRTALESSELIRNATLAKEPEGQERTERAEKTDRRPVLFPPERKEPFKKSRPAEPFETNRMQLEKETSESSGIIRDREKKEEPKYEQARLLTEESRKRHRLIGNVFDTYWIIEFDGSMYIIDQHAAHEKVMYEKLLKQFREDRITSQNLMPPLIVTLSEPESALLLSRQEEFQKIGYDIEPFGGNEYAVRAVPDILPSVLKEDLLKEMIGNLSEETDAGLPMLIIEKTASMSCKAAVKGGQRISASEADKLIDELLQLEDPYNCPHGRPTIIRITRNELEKKFKRIL
jgi:DNA mismatch repair protein MutL